MIGLIVGGALIFLFVVVLFWFIALYNGLVRKRVDADNGWIRQKVQIPTMRRSSVGEVLEGRPIAKSPRASVEEAPTTN